MPHLAQGDIQLGLEIRRRARLCPRRRSPPSVGGGKAVFPGIQPVGADPQLLGDHFRGLAAGQPVVNGFAFERFIEFTTGLDGCLCHGLVGSLSTQFSVRQFEAALIALVSEKTNSNSSDELKLALMEKELQDSKDFTQHILATVYFCLGTVIVVLLAMVGFGWYQNVRAYEKDKEV